MVELSAMFHRGRGFHLDICMGDKVKGPECPDKLAGTGSVALSLRGRVCCCLVRSISDAKRYYYVVLRLDCIL